MSRHRNKFVIREECGHPGHRTTIITATRADLKALADELGRNATEGLIIPYVAHHYATMAHGESSRVALQFEAASEAEMDAFHRPSAAHRFLRPVLRLGWAALGIVGAIRVWHWITASL
jgi:hypothetical protein